MSWAAEAYTAIKKIVLLEDRVENLAKDLSDVTASLAELDRRLIRIEAKFELLERMAVPARRSLPEKSTE